MISRRAVSLTNQSIEGRTLEGYASLYGAESRTLREGGRIFTERIAPGAFDASLSSDVKLYYMHDASMPLARTKSGTLTLTSDARGLKFRANLPETTLGNDVRALMERGDLSGEMSFGFVVERDTWSKDQRSRTVERARLLEISIVQDAAYPQTSSSLRSSSVELSRALAARFALHINRMKHV